MAGTPGTPQASELSERDALLAGREAAWWDAFYADRTRPVPFFGTSPDESLAQWLAAGTIPRGAALDIGCGNGRNSVHLARAGFAAEGVDCSGAAVAWATQQAAEAGVDVRFHQASVFDLALAPGSYDLLYDSGCFHHMPPHRRAGYVALVAAALKPGGWFGLACFRPEGGSGLSDEEAYRQRTLGGGLGYTEPRLREIWSGPFTIRVLRQMQPHAAGSEVFGQSFLWAMLAQKAQGQSHHEISPPHHRPANRPLRRRMGRP